MRTCQPFKCGANPLIRGDPASHNQCRDRPARAKRTLRPVNQAINDGLLK